MSRFSIDISSVPLHQPPSGWQELEQFTLKHYLDLPWWREMFSLIIRNGYTFRTVHRHSDTGMFRVTFSHRTLPNAKFYHGRHHAEFVIHPNGQEVRHQTVDPAALYRKLRPYMMFKNRRSMFHMWRQS